MYWAAEGSATFGEFTIETTSHEIFQDFSQREFTVAKKKVGLVVCRNSFWLFPVWKLALLSFWSARKGWEHGIELLSDSDHFLIFTLMSTSWLSWLSLSMTLSYSSLSFIADLWIILIQDASFHTIFQGFLIRSREYPIWCSLPPQPTPLAVSFANQYCVQNLLKSPCSLIHLKKRSASKLFSVRGNVKVIVEVRNVKVRIFRCAVTGVTVYSQMNHFVSSGPSNSSSSSPLPNNRLAW